MTLKERMDVIETLTLMKKHKKFARRVGLVDKTKFVVEERRNKHVNKEN